MGEQIADATQASDLAALMNECFEISAHLL